MTRSTADVIAELGRRQVHVRQYLGERRYEVWADGERKGKFTAPIDAESTSGGSSASRPRRASPSRRRSSASGRRREPRSRASSFAAAIAARRRRRRATSGTAAKSRVCVSRTRAGIITRRSSDALGYRARHIHARRRQAVALRRCSTTVRRVRTSSIIRPLPGKPRLPRGFALEAAVPPYTPDTLPTEAS